LKFTKFNFRRNEGETMEVQKVVRCEEEKIGRKGEESKPL